MKMKVWKGVAVLLALLFAGLTACDLDEGGGSKTPSATYIGNAGGKTYTLTITESSAKAYTPKVNDKYVLKIKKNGEADKTSSGYVLFIVPAGAGGGSIYTLQPTATPPGEPAGTTAPTFEVTVNNTNGITSIDASDTDGDGMADDTKITLDGAQGEDDPPGHVNPGVGTIVVPPDGNYKLGDRGPGGGIVFLYNSEGFQLVPGSTYIYHYMEADVNAANTNSNFKSLTWSSPQYYPEVDDNKNTDQPWNDVAATEEYISGFWNTVQILDADPNAPAAKACDEYRGGGYEDWFLPCIEELLYLTDVLSDIGVYLDSGHEGGSYWSSTQNPDTYTYGIDYGIKVPYKIWAFRTKYGQKQDDIKRAKHNVVPIRAF